jgi:hypothetical protein
MRRSVAHVAMVGALIAMTLSVVGASPPSEVFTSACSALPALGSHWVSNSGESTSAPSSQDAYVQEFAAAQGTKLQVVTRPDGFNPAIATDETLQAFSIPPRPKDPGALAAWNATFGHPLHEVPPPKAPCETDRQNILTDTDPAMSGRLETSSGFTDVSGQFTQPTFVSYCLHLSDRSIWNGIGGWFTGTAGLIQAGTDTNGPGIRDVDPWVEVYPLENEIVVPSPAVSAGNVLGVDTSYSATFQGGTASWHFYNHSTGVSITYQHTGVSKYYDGRSAEYFDERATQGGSPLLLRKSSNSTVWSYEYVNGQVASHWTTTAVTMLKTSTLMAPAIGTTTGSSETWKDCGPSSGTNQ